MQQNQPAYLIIQLGNRWTDILRLQAGQKILVGRSSECNVVVKEEGVSRKHAEVFPENGGWVVRDLGSRNGTQVEKETIEGERPLKHGQTIGVGGCRMTFSIGLGAGIPQRYEAVSETQQTAEVQPTIVNRLSNSQWSSEGIDASSILAPRNAQDSTENWSFFYRLISELISANSREAAAQVALDRLLDRMQLSMGGVIMLESDSESGADALSVLATRQAAGSSYHRVSDFLVQTVTHEKQAVLARNIRDDSKLSVARASGQREVVSIICAPLRISASDSDRSGDQMGQVLGLLHVYSAGDERMLSNPDLELAVGVADNLAIALSQQTDREMLTRSLESSRRKAEQLEQQLEQSTVMVGASQAMRQVKTTISRAGPTNATVLVRGESGVGKELVARAIHAASQRSDGPLICMNCAALAPTLLESELFGHEKGAFTGATERKQGKFEAANGGTLMLDEIGEMSPELQAKFLRVLEGQPFERLGGNKAIQSDVRVIAATNRDLEEAVQAKEFRSDLYFRLRVIELHVPPLRERAEDIPLLVEHFVNQLRHHAGRQLSGTSPAALEILTRHHWPGNVRELRNVIERAVVLGGSCVIEPEDLNIATSLLPAEETGAVPATATFHPISLAELERKHIESMLKHTEGNKTRAAQFLGIERSTLDRKLKRYEREQRS